MKKRLEGVRKTQTVGETENVSRRGTNTVKSGSVKEQETVRYSARNEVENTPRVRYAICQCVFEKNEHMPIHHQYTAVSSKAT